MGTEEIRTGNIMVPTPDKLMNIAAISDKVTAESRETEDTADWIGHATKNEAHYDSSTDSEDES